MKILLVDDDPDAVLLTSFVLEAAGWEVVSAGCGADALQVASQESPDAVLLDFLLPDMDGEEVLQRLRRHPAHVKTPVVFLTGKEQPELVARLKRQGALGVLHKPLNPETMAQEVESLLAGRGNGTDGDLQYP